MSNRLELPDDLASLIEKREQDDRRQAAAGPPSAIGERRSGVDRRDADLPPAPPTGTETDSVR
ncbi:hypothetical protein [Botrimarina mediterranea]|uniref:Uncharacterized protein n=1 Tax=Botrimarina mediterranea TaxID=2528022 RepID=A0A518K8Y5_9BACT|nr:hypothetical protein [Botrimarina mediterranea]QDV74255.1 hypothetical protein Spa11_24550 [Botrimarina mediterranea]QDV78886.1 hypothetical protein K2D_24940 [Planctomycetes bacterium K2D]